MVKLSIVIAYYDAYEYTKKLLKELRIQKTDDVEIILVDDGCNETRLDEFADIAKIIHLEQNGGFPHALNIGLKYVSGEYVGFIDSDDMITMDYIDVLLKAINERKEDVIYFNWLDRSINSVITRPQNYAIWKAIYKREILPVFDEEWLYHTDVPFQEDLAKKKPTEYYIDVVLYLYNSNRVGSLTWKENNCQGEKNK